MEVVPKLYWRSGRNRIGDVRTHFRSCAVTNAQRTFRCTSRTLPGNGAVDWQRPVQPVSAISPLHASAHAPVPRTWESNTDDACAASPGHSDGPNDGQREHAVQGRRDQRGSCVPRGRGRRGDAPIAFRSRATPDARDGAARYEAEATHFQTVLDSHGSLLDALSVPRLCAGVRGAVAFGVGGSLPGRLRPAPSEHVLLHGLCAACPGGDGSTPPPARRRGRCGCAMRPHACPARAGDARGSARGPHGCRVASAPPPALRGGRAA